MVLGCRIAVGLALIAVMGRAFYGTPAKQPRPWIARSAASAAVLADIVGGYLVLRGHRTEAGAVLTGGVLSGCLGAWLARSPGRSDPGDDDHGEPRDPEPDGPPDPRVDWDAFDRARAGWGPRQPAA